MLFNTQTGDGTILATGNDAIAESKQVIQKQTSNDFRKVKVEKVMCYLIDCSTATIADTLTSDYTFQEGQIIVVNVLGEYKTLVLDSGNLSGNVVDTISITAGKIPSDAYILPSIFSNNVQHQYIFDEYHVFEIFNSKLLCQLLYEPVTIPFFRSVTSKVFLPISGSIILELSLDLIQTNFEVGTDTLTSDGTDIQDSNNVVDAWKAFDGVDSNAYSALADSNGDVDIHHTYYFPTAKQVMKLKVKCDVAINAPKVITLLGSNNNTDFDTLLVLNQDIVINNYTIDKRLDINKYAEYNYYKIHITKGTPDTEVIVNEYYLMTEV